MKLTRTTVYALAAVAYIAKNTEDSPIPAKVVAKFYEIPLEYLLKILQLLVRADILRGMRGPNGGYSLVKNPKNITLYNVIEAVEGPLDASSILDISSGSLFPKLGSSFGQDLARIYRKAADEMIKILDSTSLTAFFPTRKAESRKKKARR